MTQWEWIEQAVDYLRTCPGENALYVNAHGVVELHTVGEEVAVTIHHLPPVPPPVRGSIITLHAAYLRANIGESGNGHPRA